MQDRDDHQVIEELIAILRSREVGLDMLVEQYLDTVKYGRVVEVDAKSTSTQTAGSYPQKVLPGDVRRRDLTTAEQLGGLFDLVEVAVAGSVDVEMRAVEMATTFLPDSIEPTITFSEDNEQPGAAADLPTVISRSDESRAVTAANADRLRAAQAVLETLRELRQATDVSRGDWLEPQEERLSSTRPQWR